MCLKNIFTPSDLNLERKKNSFYKIDIWILILFSFLLISYIVLTVFDFFYTDLSILIIMSIVWFLSFSKQIWNYHMIWKSKEDDGSSKNIDAEKTNLLIERIKIIIEEQKKVLKDLEMLKKKVEGTV